MLYSILITSYECYGKGYELLRENLLAVFSQTYRPIQCIVSDHSKDNAIEAMIKTLDFKGVELIYARYSEHYGNPCHNWNNALKYATGDYIQYLAMDDRLAHATAVEDVVTFMKHSNAKWVAVAHTTSNDGKEFIPKWNDDILHYNTISGPSAIVLDTSLKHITLDPQFTWLLDLDWYYRLYKEAGKPTILAKIIFVNRVHPHQLTRTICDTVNFKKNEDDKLLIKYGHPLPKSP
jgi:glycosyltransferase involved in cell wall biosynthesis